MTRLPDSYRNRSISTGTMRERDLIPVFISTLCEVNVEHRLVKEYNSLGEAIELVAEWVGKDEMNTVVENIYDTDRAMEFCAELFDALDEVAPEGTHFGAIEGDGSDYGFWDNEPEPVARVEIPEKVKYLLNPQYRGNDPWAWVMECIFGISSTLTLRDFGVPEEWGYSPGGRMTEDTERKENDTAGLLLDAVDNNEIDEEDLVKAGNVLRRYRDMLVYAGRSY